MWAGLMRSGTPTRLRERSNDSSVRTPYPARSVVMRLSCRRGVRSGCRTVRTKAVEVVLAHQGAADLERGRSWQLLDPLARDGPLVPGQPVREVLHKLLFGGVADQRHHCRGHLAQPRVGQSHGRGLIDGRVREQRVLDNAGRDLETTPVNRIIRPAADE